MKRSILITFFAFAMLSLNAQIVLNEFSASNHDSFDFDPDGFEEDYTDWVELYNPTGGALDAGGYFLSDDAANPMKFEIPAGTIVPANGHLVVLCTGFFEVTPMRYGYLNTNFKVTQTKPEAIIFSDDTGAVLSQFEFGVDLEPTQRNHCFARLGDGSANWGIVEMGTPGAANGAAGFGSYAQEVVADTDAGYYAGAVNVSLSHPDPNVTIYYTTDGSIPSDASTVYAGPINLSTTTPLRAIAYNNTDTSVAPSLVLTNTYFFGMDQHTIPVVNISGASLNDGNWFGDELTHIEFFDDNGAFWVESTGDSNEHGNDSNAYDQRGFDYVTRDEMGSEWAIFAELFSAKNRDDFQRVIFKAAANDNYTFSGGGHIRDAYCQTLSDRADLKLDERTNENCILYINGQYWGVYEYREKVDDPDFTIEYYDQPRNFLDYIKTWGGTWDEYGSRDDWDDLVTFITTNDMTDPANYDYVTSVYNVTSLMDYMILNSYVVNADWLNWNTSWWRGRHPDGSAKKWRYSLWDMDNTFGHGVNFTNLPDVSPGADPCNPDDLGDTGGQGHIPVFNALQENPDFQAEYYNRWASLSNTYFSCEYMNALLDEMTQRIAPEMQRQCDRWGGTYAGWEASVQEIRDFIDTRCATTTTDGLVDCYDIEPATVTIIIDGLGEVDVASALVTDIMSPWEGTYWQDVPIDLEGIGVGGGSFLYWEVQSGTLVIPDPTDPNQEIIIEDDVVLIAHFGVPEPVDVMFDVQPPGAGDLLFDATIMAPYPNTQTVAPGNYNLDATPANQWFVFDHWETNNAVINPDVTTATGSTFIGQTDTITAVFTEIPHFDLSVNVEPAGAGTIVMDGGAITVPWSNTLEGDITYNFVTASAGQWFEFSHWEINNHVLSPDEFSTDVDLTLTASDELVAVYNVIEHASYTVIIDPPFSGNVTLDNGVVVSDDYTQDVAIGTQVEMLAKPNQFFLFEEYTSDLLNPSPNNTTPEVQYTILASDTIVVHFEKEPYSMYVPNSFTPNNDGRNDIFRPVGQAVDVSSYELLIFNRWGEVVFRSDNPEEGWDGSHENGEYYVDNQVFFYRMKLRSVHEPDERVVEGHITVLR